MLHLPIVIRELRTAAAEHDVLLHRNRVARWTCIGMACLLAAEWAGLPILRGMAVPLYFAAALTAVALPAKLCLGLILDERRAGTLGHLFLAGVRPGQLFLSKTAAALSMIGSLLVGLVPFVALPFLTGGLSSATFVGMLVLLPALMLASLGISLFLSTVARNEAMAFTSALVICVVWAAGLPAVYWMGRVVAGSATFPESWLTLTPMYPLLLIGDGLNAANSANFWRSVGVLLLVGCSTLSGAALLLPRIWRREIATSAGTRQAAESRHRVAPASSADPVAALLRLERPKLRWNYAALLAFFTLWLAGAVMWGKLWLNSSMALALMLLLALISSTAESLLLISCICRYRREGAFEELLVAPVQAADIVDGFVLGHARLVQPLRRLAAALGGLICLTAACARSWNAAALLSYSVISALLIAMTLFRRHDSTYRAFRLAILTGSTGITYGRLSGNTVGVLAGQSFNLYNMFQRLRGMGQLPLFPQGGPIEVALVVGGGVIVTAVAIGLRSSAGRTLAIDELRRLIAEPLAHRKDPRFVNWKADAPVPALE